MVGKIPSSPNLGRNSNPELEAFDLSQGAYKRMGIRSFIFSGNPHIYECKAFGAKTMPELKTCSLPHAYGRVPDAVPETPLGTGERR